MAIPDDVINEAVARYGRERDRYLKLANRVEDIVRSSIVDENAIRAQVTSRTKSIKSFESKLRRFSKRPDKNYASASEVFAGVGDFAGVRIATYQPEDEERVAKLVAKIFQGPTGTMIDIDRKDKLKPAEGSFYRATHCQVYLPDAELVGDYENLRGVSCEIQICSMMAHVWNEIEHDIGYKPEGGGPADAERGLLETLGHLARAGDAAITRLLAANQLRMEAQKGDFSDVHEFVAQIQPFFPNADLSVNAGMAFGTVKSLGLGSLDRLRSRASDNLFDVELAQKRIAAFNAFLDRSGRHEAALNPSSADLFAIGLLHSFTSELREATKSVQKGHSIRMSDVIDAFADFTQTDDFRP